MADVLPALGDRSTTRRRTHDFDADHPPKGTKDRADRVTLYNDRARKKKMCLTKHFEGLRFRIAKLCVLTQRRQSDERSAEYNK